MSLDTYTDHNPNAPWNQEELPALSELEQQQEWNMEMKSKLQKAKEQLVYCISLVPEHQTLLLNNLKKIKL